MKKTLKIFTIGSLACLFLLGTAFNSFAQSDGVIVYSDTFTTGENESEYNPRKTCIFDNRNFMFRVDEDAIVNRWKNEYGYNIKVRDGVQIGELVNGIYTRPITKGPYKGDPDVEVKEVANGVYSLEGLDLKENQIYSITVDIIPAPGESDSLSGFDWSYFMFTSTGNGNSVAGGTGNTGNAQLSGADDWIDDYWVQNEVGWRVQCSDGTYLVNKWYQSPASGLWYYMGADGYMLTNTVTPDGYTVNADGVWVQ